MPIIIDTDQLGLPDMLPHTAKSAFAMGCYALDQMHKADVLDEYAFEMGEGQSLDEILGD